MVSLEDAKKHLVVDFTDDDNYIYDLIGVSEQSVFNYIGEDINYFTDNNTCVPSPIKHAILMIIGNLYAQREPVSSARLQEVPYTLRYLLEPYKNWTIL